MPDAAGLEPPPHLRGEALEEWRRLAPQLRVMRLLSALDVGLLAAWCSAWADLVTAERHLARDGLVVEGREGQLVRSPWFMVKSRSIDALLKLGARFGFSPSDRVRLAVNGPADPAGNALDEYLAQKPDRLAPH